MKNDDETNVRTASDSPKVCPEAAYDLERTVMLEAYSAQSWNTRTYSQEEFSEMVKQHEMWLDGNGGRRLSLSGVSLFGLHATNRRLDGIELTQCELDYCDFAGSSFRDNAAILWCQMKGTNFRNASFSKSHIIFADEQSNPATIPMAIFSGATIIDCDISSAQGEQQLHLVFADTPEGFCDCAGTKFTGIDFLHCKGRILASVTDASMRPTVFAACKIFETTLEIRTNCLVAEQCSFIFVQNTFKKANILEGSQFFRCRFTWCYFENVLLSGSLFRNCVFHGGGFPRANLSDRGLFSSVPTEFIELVSRDTAFLSARMARVRMNRAILIGSKFNGSSDISNGSFIEANFLNAEGLDDAPKVGANFSGSIWNDGTTCGYGSVGECHHAPATEGVKVLKRDEFDSVRSHHRQSMVKEGESGQATQ